MIIFYFNSSFLTNTQFLFIVGPVVKNLTLARLVQAIHFIYYSIGGAYFHTQV